MGWYEVRIIDRKSEPSQSTACCFDETDWPIDSRITNVGGSVSHQKREGLSLF